MTQPASSKGGLTGKQLILGGIGLVAVAIVATVAALSSQGPDQPSYRAGYEDGYNYFHNVVVSGFADTLNHVDYYCAGAAASKPHRQDWETGCNAGGNAALGGNVSVTVNLHP